MAFNQQQQQQQRSTHHTQTISGSSVSSRISQKNYVNSHLEDSEWILFSPTNSNETDYGNADNLRDILSSNSNGTLSDKPLEEEEKEESELEDSLLDSFNEELMENKSSIYSDNDLETRINNWRKDQIHDLLKDLTDRGSDRSFTSKCAADLEKIEFMKSWGIDDGKIRLRKNKRKSCKVPKKELRDIFYGSELLKGLSDRHIHSIRKVVQMLSKELTLDDQKRDKRKETSLHSVYLRNLQERNKDLKIANRNNQIGLLHNPDLEKYLPMFIKDLIIEQKNRTDFVVNGIDHPLNEGVSHTSSNFWDSDLKSCNSSILSMSTNSFMFKFNLNEYA